jgi:copper chaperone
MKKEANVFKVEKRSNSEIETSIQIDNLSCDGCAHTIEKALLGITGVEKVTVLLKKEEVKIHHKADTDLLKIKEKLKDLGYPEAGTTHGFEKIGRNIKSYFSCAIGRLDNKK